MISEVISIMHACARNFFRAFVLASPAKRQGSL